MRDKNSPVDLSAVKWPARLTYVGLWAERITQAFWPFWTVLLFASVIGFMPWPEAWPTLIKSGLAAISVMASLIYGVRRFRLPSRAEALDRVDRSLPGRPVTAAMDSQAIGAGDIGSEEIWAAHKSRMQAKLAEARAVEPDLRVSKRDPFALRYVALLFAVTVLGIGGVWRQGALDDLTGDLAGPAIAAGPAWELWLEPPAYTGKPTLYLNDIKQAAISVPKGSELTVRLYGQVGSVSLTETVSGQSAPLSEEGAPLTAYSLDVVQDGEIAVEDRSWAITTSADELPTVTLAGEVSRKVAGEMELPFEATDDYAVVAGTATVTLDLASVDRRYGLVLDPEPREEIILDLPMPISGGRENFTEVVIENLSEHPWATLPVTIELQVIDAAEQLSEPELVSTELPGRRFFQPIAKSVIEMRRDLLWNRENAKRIGQVLRTITYAPDEDYFPSEQAFLQLRMAITRLEIASEHNVLDDEKRDEIADLLWRTAVLLEDGRLSDALERLRRAQERLSDAMRDGATDEEISELMQELAEAMQQYMEQLAQEQQQQGDQQAQAPQDGQEMSQDQLQQMLDEIERLMQEGRMAEAQALLDQLMEMMQNMQVTQGQQGQGGQGQQAMEGLQETLREQQGLSDEAFRDLQEQFNPGAQAGENQGNEGRNGGQGRGQSHEGGEGGEQQDGQEGGGQQQAQPGQDGQGGAGDERSLADRQEALRQELNRQRRNLPGAGTPEGDAARESLGQADDAMERAEEALRNDQTAEALGAQSEAMDALREGLRNLGEALAEQQQQQGGQQGTQQGDAQSPNQDPLGREAGTNGMIGSEDNMLQGEDARRRSRELFDEIRRRSGEQERPEIERDYLKRLLDRF